MLIPKAATMHSDFPKIITINRTLNKDEISHQQYYYYHFLLRLEAHVAVYRC